MAGQGLTLLETRLAAKGISPSIIQAIIAALTAILGGICPAPTPASLKVRRGNRIRMVVGIKRESPVSTYPDCFVYADAAFTCADEATDAENQSVIDDCTT